MHPLRKARRTHKNRMLTQEELAHLTGLSKSTIERAERGEPVSWYTQQQLCDFFEKTAQELGLIGEECEDGEEVLSEQRSMRGVAALPISQSMQTLQAGGASVPTILTRYQPVNTFLDGDETSPEQALGVWLARGASDLAGLFDEGWTLENLLGSLEVVLKGVQAMPKFNRRKLLQLGAAAVVSGIPVVDGKHVSVEEKTQLHSALAESIAAGWRLFHTAGNAQVLAVGQAQLFLIQQNHSILYPRFRSMFYSSTYNMLGRALHHQEHYQDALEAHTNAHVAAMGTGDAWYIVQSLICQADSYQALGLYSEAIEVIEEALHTIGNPNDEERIRSKAHLLACWADNAMSMKDHRTAQKKLEASAMYLDQISPNEEFDRASWLQLAGKNALMSQDFQTAIEHFENALAELPTHWILRGVGILVPLAMAYARAGEQNKSLEVARKAIPVISAVNAPMTNKHFTEYIRYDLSPIAQDSNISMFVKDVRNQFPQLAGMIS